MATKIIATKKVKQVIQRLIKTGTYLDNSEVKELSQNRSMSKESVDMF